MKNYSFTPKLITKLSQESKRLFRKYRNRVYTINPHQINLGGFFDEINVSYGISRKLFKKRSEGNPVCLQKEEGIKGLIQK